MHISLISNSAFPLFIVPFKHEHPSTFIVYTHFTTYLKFTMLVPLWAIVMAMREDQDPEGAKMEEFDEEASVDDTPGEESYKVETEIPPP
jgi:hypothetical protein